MIVPYQVPFFQSLGIAMKIGKLYLCFEVMVLTSYVLWGQII